MEDDNILNLEGRTRLSADITLLMLKGALGSVFAVTETLARATPLILTGLAAAPKATPRRHAVQQPEPDVSQVHREGGGQGKDDEEEGREKEEEKVLFDRCRRQRSLLRGRWVHHRPEPRDRQRRPGGAAQRLPA